MISGFSLGPISQESIDLRAQLFQASKWNFQESKSNNQGSKYFVIMERWGWKRQFHSLCSIFYAHLYKWDKKIPILRSDLLGIEWTDDFWFVTQLANHNFMNEQQQQQQKKLATYHFNIYNKGIFKGGPSDLRTKVYKNTEKSSLYSQSLLMFIHKTPVVESPPTPREIRDLLRPRLTPKGNTVYFYMSISLIYILKTHWQSFKHSIRWRHEKWLHFCYVMEFKRY